MSAPATSRVHIDGRAPRTTTGRAPWMSVFMVAAPLLGTALVLSLSVAPASDTPATAAGAGVELARTHRGLLADEPFDEPEALRTFEDRFELDPLAPGGGMVFAGVGTHGLDVGVRDHDGWQGYFAVTHDLYPAGSVFHTDVEALPPRVDVGGVGEAVFAVQTGSTKITSDVNFVTVNTYSTGGRLGWQVGYSAGKYQDADRTSLAQVDDLPPTLVPDHPVGITLRTDGYSRLAVYLDDTRVLDTTDLDIFVEPPLQPYLEVQARDIPYTSRFTNFWVTASATLAIEGLPTGTEVRLGSASDPVASAAADASGAVRLHLPLPRAHGTAALWVRRSGRGWQEVTASFPYSGGDRFEARVTGDD